MTIDPFGGELREGKLWGRGASDTKGPMASMLWGLYGAHEQIASLGYEIWYAGLVGEEAGQHGAHALAKEEHFDFVIAGEPTSLDVVFTHKGCTNLRLTTRGKAVHSSRPETGENAIYKMAEVVRFIHQKLVPEMRRYSHPVLGHSTISVGTITGGSKTNIVPDLCEATVDIRTVPTQNTPDFTERLTQRLQVACPDLEVAAGHSTSPAHQPTASGDQGTGKLRLQTRGSPLVLRCRGLREGWHRSHCDGARLHCPGTYRRRVD